MNSFAAYFKSPRDTTFVTNSLRFATIGEAEAYGRDLFRRWLGASEWEVRPHADTPNYRFADGTLSLIEQYPEDALVRIEPTPEGGAA